MMNQLSDSDLELCAYTVAELGSDQPEDVRSSLAWVLKNRLQQAIAGFGNIPNIAGACETVLREAVGRAASELSRPRVSDDEWRRIRALNYLVWTGDIADRTGGAIACHRHDTAPAWARGRTATALLGSFLFFR